MSEQFSGVLITALATCIVAIIILIGNIIVKKIRPPMTPVELWKRVDELTQIIYGDGTKDDPGLLARMAQAERRAELAESKSDALHGRLESSEKQSVEMIHHILVLEDMVPNPPGPPVRPKWRLPILTERPPDPEPA